MPPTFAELGVPADLCSRLERDGITAPFPVQAAVLPAALAGRDVCGKAPTGSGKTVAFALGAIAALERAPRAESRRPRGLVLVPTRELAAQVRDVLAGLGASRGLRIAAIYGGSPYAPQLRALKARADLLVACPGRLEDLLERREVYLDDVVVAVVDEADRMADMGFLPAVRRILDLTAPESKTRPQVLLFSATLDGDVEVLIRRYQRDPERVDVAGPSALSGPVRHRFFEVERSRRVAVAAEVVASHDSAIVFCRTRHGADRLTRQLESAGVEAVALHGSRTQAQRDRALRAFHSGTARALVATDVAARGIDVENVSCVVHFDPPGDAKDYLHRSGRTGRAGASGTVISLVMPDQARATRSIQRGLGLPEHLEVPDVTDARRPPLVRTGSPKALRGSRAQAAVPPSSRANPGTTPTGPRSPALRRVSDSSRRTEPRRGSDWSKGPEPRRAPGRPSSSPSRAGSPPSTDRYDKPGSYDRTGSPPSTGVQSKGVRTMTSGTLKFFDQERGFGFLVADAGGRDILVRRRALASSGQTPRNGARVRFRSRTAERGPEAIEVEVLAQGPTHVVAGGGRRDLAGRPRRRSA